MSAFLSLRNLNNSDYANTRALMSERFCSEDVHIFIQLWKSRNREASFCLEWMGTILGFILVTNFKIQYLVVHKQWEGHRFGEKLLKVSIQAIKHQGYRSVILTTAVDKRLRAWYSKHGFEYSSTFCDAAGISGDRMILRFRVKRAVCDNF